MSRKTLSLGYIYEMRGEYEKAIICFQNVLNENKEEFILEAKTGMQANNLALKYKENNHLYCSNLDMEKMNEKISEFINDKKKSIRWLSKWN